MNKITTFWEDTAKVWLHEMRDMFKDRGSLALCHPTTACLSLALLMDLQ